MPRTFLQDPIVESVALQVAHGMVKTGGPIWEWNEVFALVYGAYMAGYQMRENDAAREQAA